MPELPFPGDLRDLLAKPNPAVVATLRADGAPVSVATWYLLDGDRILLNMDDTRVRLGHLRRDPRVSLTVLSDPSANVDTRLADDLVEVYQQRTREVFRVPYDPALVAGSVVPYSQLSANTRRQWLAACAGMAAAL